MGSRSWDTLTGCIRVWGREIVEPLLLLLRTVVTLLFMIDLLTLLLNVVFSWSCPAVLTRSNHTVHLQLVRFQKIFVAYLKIRISTRDRFCWQLIITDI